LLFSNPHDLSPLRRAVERESVTLRDLQVASNVVWTAADPINRYVFVEAVELVRRGVPSPRVQAVLQLLAEASFVKVGPAEHGRGNLCRGPAWNLPPPPMSADAARLLVTLRVKFEPSATFFARIRVADLTDSEPFDQLGLRAAAACVGTVEELAASGVLKEPVEWLDVLYPVSNVRGSKPTDEELAVAWGPASIRQQRTIATLDEVACFFTEPACLCSRLCFLFGVEGEQDAIRRQCHCFYCTAVCPPLS